MFDSFNPLQLFFGNTSIENGIRDVALSEFEESLRQAGKQSWLYSIFVNILLAISALSGSFVTLSDSSFFLVYSGEKIFLLLAVIFVLYLILISFAELQKTINLNIRKVIVLRKMLGLDYSKLHLVLPKNRVEGATNPFETKLFPGWTSFTVFPFWLISIIIFILLKDIYPGIGIKWWLLIAILLLAFFAWSFRKRLFEEHETFRLRFTYLVSNLLNIKLVKDFPWVLFRAKLAVSEIQRLGINYGKLETILIELEDKRFKKHKGIDYRSLIRGICSQIPIISKKLKLTKSGGSTISMQVVRTLFVEEYRKTIRRKLIEVLLAPWIEGQFSKKEILLLYIASVRFFEGTFGLPAAINKYWGSPIDKTISFPEAFVLIERLSNLGNKVKPQKIEAKKNLLKEKGIVKEDFDNKVEKIYRDLIMKGLLSK